MKYLYIHNPAAVDYLFDDYPNDMFSSNDYRTVTYTTDANIDHDYIDTNVGMSDRNAAHLDFASTDSTLWIHFRATIMESVIQFHDLTADGLNDPTALKITVSSSGFVFIYVNETERLRSDTNVIGSTPADIDIKIERATGTATLFVDGVQIKKVTASSFNASSLLNENMTRMRIRRTSSQRASELVITEDIPTIGMRVVNLSPATNGSEATMNGNVSDINTVGLTEANMTTVDPATHTFNYDALNAGVDQNNMVVKAVSISSVASKDELNENQTLRNVMKIGGQKHVIGDALTLSTISASTPLTTISEINPETGLPWTFAEISAIEAGVIIGGDSALVMVVGKNASDFYGLSASIGSLTSIDWQDPSVTGVDCYVEPDGNFTLRPHTAVQYQGKSAVTVTFTANGQSVSTSAITWGGSNDRYEDTGGGQDAVYAFLSGLEGQTVHVSIA